MESSYFKFVVITMNENYNELYLFREMGITTVLYIF
jgi:hypothetical protein